MPRAGRLAVNARPERRESTLNRAAEGVARVQHSIRQMVCSTQREARIPGTRARPGGRPSRHLMVRVGECSSPCSACFCRTDALIA